MSLFFQNAGLNVFNQTGQVNSTCANFLTCSTVDAVLNKVLGFLSTVVEVGKDEADSPDINMAHFVAADHAVDRTNVGACATAYATMNLREHRVLCESASSIVQKLSLIHI